MSDKPRLQTVGKLPGLAISRSNPTFEADLTPLKKSLGPGSASSHSKIWLGSRGILTGPFQIDLRSNAAFNASVSNKHFFNLARREQ
jgi:hypothetical protein